MIMSWGLPPKYKIIHHFKRDESLETINQSVLNALFNKDYEIDDKGLYLISARKKFRRTFVSLFAFARPEINLSIQITKKGRLTLESNYDYNSMFGIAIYDRGRQKVALEILLNEIISITEKNHEFKTYGTVDGESIL